MAQTPPSAVVSASGGVLTRISKPSATTSSSPQGVWVQRHLAQVYEGQPQTPLNKLVLRNPKFCWKKNFDFLFLLIMDILSFETYSMIISFLKSPFSFFFLVLCRAVIPLVFKVINHSLGFYDFNGWISLVWYWPILVLLLSRFLEYKCQFLWHFKKNFPDSFWFSDIWDILNKIYADFIIIFPKLK